PSDSSPPAQTSTRLRPTQAARRPSIRQSAPTPAAGCSQAGWRSVAPRLPTRTEPFPSGLRQPRAMASTIRPDCPVPQRPDEELQPTADSARSPADRDGGRGTSAGWPLGVYFVLLVALFVAVAVAAAIYVAAQTDRDARAAARRSAGSSARSAA